MPAIDQPIEDFELATTSDQVFKPSALRGKHIVIYFYPKDDTPGCTDEASSSLNSTMPSKPKIV